VSRERLTYFLIRLLVWPFSLLPYSSIHFLGRQIGRLAFYLMRDYRKRSLSNLALASDLKIESEEKLIEYAKDSFSNLAINCLEYAKFHRETHFSKVIACENPEKAAALYKDGKGIIFFCGHQSNWEVLFLDGTTRMNGIAIGKSIKNKPLYNWIVSIRQKNGGTIIAPRNAVKEGFRALRRGTFLGIVGDQGMPGSGYSFPFLGRRAWSTTAPALLSLKTGSPIIVATTKRVKGGYKIRYSEPFFPLLHRPFEEEVTRLMNLSLSHLQESIKDSPGEWLWQHNRWKQQTPQILYKRFRHDCVAILMPEEEDLFNEIAPHLTTLKAIYPLDFLFLIVPERFKDRPLIEVDEVLTYRSPSEALKRDFRFKFVFNFSQIAGVKEHYLALSVFEVIDLLTLKELASLYGGPKDLSSILKRALTRPGTTWQYADS
jgi:KDO2-lipid IV(A) lauroyltransferase